MCDSEKNPYEHKQLKKMRQHIWCRRETVNNRLNILLVEIHLSVMDIKSMVSASMQWQFFCNLQLKTENDYSKLIISINWIYLLLHFLFTVTYFLVI